MEQIELVEIKKNYTIVIEDSLETQIRYMCSKFPTKEWSGTLFYSIEGSIEEDNLIIKAKDFYLQDIGDSTYTAFKRDVSLASFMVEHDLLDCFTGLIHSHNSMSSFFSGTDLNTLLDEGKDMNHFVSLIVNNSGEYKAAITMKVINTATGFIVSNYNTFNNKRVNLRKLPFNKNVTKVEYSYLKIKYPNSLSNPNLDSRIEELIKNKDAFKERNLFDSKPEYINKDLEEDTAPNETAVSLDTEYLNNCFIRIVSGNIMLSYSDNAFKSYCNSMEQIYSNRFPNFENFKDYAEHVVDFLLDENPLKEDYFNELLEKLISKLTISVPDNKYVNTYINLLSQWMN